MSWKDFPCKIHPNRPNSRGYVTLKIYGGKFVRNMRAHQKALEDKLGRPIRPGHEACHHCDVKTCIEPEHLYEGTRSQNVRDVIRKGRRSSK